MILVTGAAGFVGREVVRQLRGQRLPVRCLVRRVPALPVFSEPDVEIAQGDVRDLPSVKAAMAGVDAVIHLASIITEEKGATFEGVNHLGTRNVATAAREAGASKLIHMSVIGAGDLPAYPYYRSKWLGEQECLNSGIPAVVVRSSLLFGSGDGFINVLAGVARALPLVPIAGSGQAKFQVLAVEDLARCLVLALSRQDLTQTTISLGGPQYQTYDAIVDIVQETLGMRRVKMHVPMPVMRPFVQVMERVLPSFSVTSQQLDMLEMDNVGDLDVVERVFGFQPRPLRGSIDYVRKITLADAWKIAFGAMPKRIRDH